ncbi:MAG: hypothetical protein NVSMB39_3740 [Candidatus Saccharimonadales bacterium]
MVLLNPELEIDGEAPINKVEALIAAVDGKVLKRDNWGKKRLAYRISRQDFAIYVYFELSLNPESVAALDSTILITEEVLRHILVVHEENPIKAESKKDDRAESPDEDKDDKKLEKKTEKKEATDKEGDR